MEISRNQENLKIKGLNFKQQNLEIMVGQTALNYFLEAPTG